MIFLSNSGLLLMLNKCPAEMCRATNIAARAFIPGNYRIGRAPSA